MELVQELGGCEIVLVEPVSMDMTLEAQNISGSAVRRVSGECTFVVNLVSYWVGAHTHTHAHSKRRKKRTKPIDSITHRPWRTNNALLAGTYRVLLIRIDTLFTVILTEGNIRLERNIRHSLSNSQHGDMG